MRIIKLGDLTIEQNSHNPKITKQVMIKKGEIPHLTNLTQAIFPPQELANEHTHQDMYEVFFVEDGQGIIKINGTPHDISKGSCLTVEPGDTHEVINSGNTDLIITYMGIEIA